METITVEKVAKYIIVTALVAVGVALLYVQLC